jgi:protein involved in polysaccharide export with SLBB domain
MQGVLVLLAWGVCAAAPPTVGGRVAKPYLLEPPDILILDVEHTPGAGDGARQVRGQHLVRQDGTISLGTYGCVAVAALTVDQARQAIERHLSRYGLALKIKVDVRPYDHKVCYVLFDRGGQGQQVYRVRLKREATVLDALASIDHLPPISSACKIRVARPSAGDRSCYKILPVDWLAITKRGNFSTNHELLPGDRIYVVPLPKDQIPVLQRDRDSVIGGGGITILKERPVRPEK